MQATLCERTIAIDVALRSRGMREYFRGVGDSRRYSALCKTGDDWFAAPIGGAEQIIVRPVNDDYLDGLRDGGCSVDERRSGAKRAA